MPAVETNSQPTQIPASLPRRLGAIVYDSFLLFAVLFAANLPLIAFQPDHEAIEENEKMHESVLLGDGALYQLYLALVIILFFYWFWRMNKSTLGMQAWRLTIEGLDGSSVTFGQAVIRVVVSVLSWLAFGAGFLWILIDKDKLAWHDKASRTRIVYTPKEKEAKQ